MTQLIVFDDMEDLSEGLPSGVSHLSGGDPVLFGVADESDLPSGSRLATDEESADYLASALSAAKIKARAQVNTERDARISAGIEYPESSGFMYDSDTAAQNNIAGAVTLAQVSGVMDDAEYRQSWVRLDGSVASFSAIELAGLGVAIGLHKSALMVDAATVKAGIDAAESVAEVDGLLAGYSGE